MLELSHVLTQLGDRFPQLGQVAKENPRAAVELSEVLLYAPALSRSSRIEVNVEATLTDAHGIVHPARIYDLSDTGIQLGLSAQEKFTIQALLGASLTLDDAGQPLTVGVSFVRVVDDTDAELFLGFRFDAVGSADRLFDALSGASPS
ncbi:MAG: PilZ domain-containing protein [Myxococcota bacterium]